MKTPRWKDVCLLLAEWASRQVYWRCPALRAWVKRKRSRAEPPSQVADRDDLQHFLREIGVTAGSLVMLHSSVTGVRITSAGRRELVGPVRVAQAILNDLLALIGENGTLLMPTHAAYQATEPDRGRRDGTLPVYDPSSTPSSVGLVTELFRRHPDVHRSWFPFNMLAARGPLAAELLRDNLNETKPLPHGVQSGYYRFCQRNGLVVGIGVPLARCLTLVHVGEETRDASWPVKDFFEDKAYVVVVGGQRKVVTVRQTRPEYMQFSFCLRKLARDLTDAGCLHQGKVGTLTVEWAWSQQILEFLMWRNRHSSYPYYFPSLATPRRKAT